MSHNRILVLLLTWVFLGIIPVHSRAVRIISDVKRDAFIDELHLILNYKDDELKSSIPYVINPFFFEQPLLLKLRIPGGVKDQDVLKSMGELLASEITGAFIRGSKRSLLMKNGELIREGDIITRTIADFGDMETTVLIEKIERYRFVLKLNNSVRTVDLSSSE